MGASCSSINAVEPVSIAKIVACATIVSVPVTAVRTVIATGLVVSLVSIVTVMSAIITVRGLLYLIIGDVRILKEFWVDEMPRVLKEGISLVYDSRDFVFGMLPGGRDWPL